MSVKEFRRSQSAFLSLHGVDAESRMIPVPGGQAHVLVAGQGLPLVMVNGIGLPAAMWAPLMARLDDVTIHAVDMPGYGLTETDQPLVRPSLAGGATAFLTAVLDGLGLARPAFVANSFGSWCVLRLAMARPERVGPMVHVGCPAVVEGTSAPLPMRLLSVAGLGALMTRLRPPSPDQVRDLGRMVGEAPLPDDVVDLLVATARLPHHDREFRPTLRHLLRVRGARPGRELLRSDLVSVTQPTAFVWGTGDPFGSVAAGQAAAAAMQDAEFHAVPGGHAPWIHHPDEVAARVRPFLARHATT